MARSRVRTSQSVSLFPFLAVLVCAMGALILLLIVTTRRIRSEAVAKAAVIKPKSDKPESTVPRLVAPGSNVIPTVPEIDQAVPASRETDRIIAAYTASTRRHNAQMSLAVRQLEKQRRDALQEFEALAAKRKSTEQQLRNAQLQLRQLESAKRKLVAETSADVYRIDDLEKQIQAAATNADRYRRELAVLKLKQAQASSKFAIVPFDGRTGTTRRPIFIECTKDSLRILPEDITITAGDLTGFTTTFNPVSAGVQSLVDYWTAKKNRDSTGQEPEPYILLLVRPGGSVAYYAARKLLRELGRPIGYELIEPDWTLAMPPVDPEAKAVCQKAIDRALAQRRRAMDNILAARRGYGGGEGNSGSGGSFGGSGFAGSEGSSSSGDEQPGGSGGRMMRFNRSTGRFEVVEQKHEPSLGPFGKTLDDGKERFPGGSESGDPRASATRATHGQKQETEVTAGSQQTGNGTKGNSTQSTPGGNIADATQGTNSSNKPGATATGTNGSPDDPFQSLTGQSGKPGSQDTPGSPDGTKETGPFAGSPNGAKNSESQSGTAGTNPSSTNGGGSKTGGNPGESGGSASIVLGNTGRKSQGGNSNSSSMFTQKHRWGLSDPRAGIGFEREITVWSSADTLRIGKGRILAVGKGESREELLRAVVAGIDAEARSWGRPPSSFYWVPTLRFVISPGGNRHYDRLKTGLQKFGLPSVAEQRLEPTPPPIPTR